MTVLSHTRAAALPALPTTPEVSNTDAATVHRREPWSDDRGRPSDDTDFRRTLDQAMRRERRDVSTRSTERPGVEHDAVRAADPDDRDDTPTTETSPPPIPAPDATAPPEVPRDEASAGTDTTSEADGVDGPGVAATTDTPNGDDTAADAAASDGAAQVEDAAVDAATVDTNAAQAAVATAALTNAGLTNAGLTNAGLTNAGTSTTTPSAASSSTASGAESSDGAPGVSDTAGSIDAVSNGAASGDAPSGEVTAPSDLGADVAADIEPVTDSADQPAVDPPGAVSSAATPGSAAATDTARPVVTAPTGVAVAPGSAAASPALPTAPTDAATPVEPAPEPRGVELGELGTRLGATLRRNERMQTLTIQLHPAELGAIKVEARLIDGVTHLHVTSDSANTADRLASTMSELRHQLERAGVDVGDLDLGGRSEHDGDDVGTTPARRHPLDAGATGPAAATETHTTTNHRGGLVAIDL